MITRTDDSLRQSETNAAGDESDGGAWGVPFHLLWIALGGVTSGGLVFGALFQGGSSLMVSAVSGGSLAGMTIAWVIFKQSHPPGYDTDLIVLWIYGPGFGPKPPTPDLHELP